VFTRQLAILMGAGVPLVASLETLSRGEDPLSARVVPQLARRVAQGARLSAAFQSFPRVFPPAYVWLIRGGEETGALHRLLHHLADWLERQDRLLRQVKKALTYPCLVVALVSVLTIALFRTVIPRILEAVLGMGAALPPPTKALLTAVHLVQSPWAWMLFVLIAAAVVGYLRSPQGSRAALRVLLGTPVVGDLLRCAACARMGFTLAMLLESGTEVTRAIAIAGSASGLPPMAEDSERVRGLLRQGDELSHAYQGSSLYPPLLSDMLKAGEESGKMTELIRHASRILEEETYGRLDSLTNLLEPIILAGISLGVGFILVATILPMTTMLQTL
jgi:type IV pilus assembly protein PilC